MELVPGINLGDIWDNLTNEDRTTVIRRLVGLESQLFAFNFPAGGSSRRAQEECTVSRSPFPAL